MIQDNRQDMTDEEFAEMITLEEWDKWINMLNAEKINLEDDAKKFMETYGIKNPKAPVVLMYHAFTGGLSAGLQLAIKMDKLSEEKEKQGDI